MTAGNRINSRERYVFSKRNLLSGLVFNVIIVEFLKKNDRCPEEMNFALTSVNPEGNFLSAFSKYLRILKKKKKNLSRTTRSNFPRADKFSCEQNAVRASLSLSLAFNL